MRTVGAFEVRKFQNRDGRVGRSQCRAVIQMNGREIDATPRIGAEIVKLAEYDLGFVLIGEECDRDALTLFVADRDLALEDAGQGGLLHRSQRDLVGTTDTKLLLQIVLQSGIPRGITRDCRIY